MCTKAVEWGYLKADPQKFVKFLKEPPGRLRYLTREEMGALVATCPPHLKPIVATAMNTGMRKSEILGLKWQDVDFGTRTITVTQTKNNELRVIPMNRTLYEELRQLPRPLYSVYVFRNDKGERYDEVKRSFNTACRRAEIADFHFHDRRHTFASHLMMNSRNLKTVQALLGHKDIRMTLRYSHLSREHLQAAVNTLDAGMEVGTKREQDTSA